MGVAMMVRATMVNMGMGTREENPVRILHLIIKLEIPGVGHGKGIDHHDCQKQTTVAHSIKIRVPYVLFDSFLLFAGILPARKSRRFIEEKRYLVPAISPLCHHSRSRDAHSTGDACYDRQQFDYSL